MRLAIGTLIGLVLIGILVALLAAWRWRLTTAALVAKLDEAARRSHPSGAILDASKQYIARHGEGMPDIRDWTSKASDAAS